MKKRFMTIYEDILWDNPSVVLPLPIVYSLGGALILGKKLCLMYLSSNTIVLRYDYGLCLLVSTSDR